MAREEGKAEGKPRPRKITIMPRLYSQVILQHCDNIDYIQLQQNKNKNKIFNKE